MSLLPNTTNRMLQLDVLRGIAVLLVMGHHIVLQPKESGIFEPLENVFIRFGWSGVDLFFVLSGFLVGGLLFSELHKRSKIDVQRFIIRRGFKIWPSYFAYLLVLFLILLVGESGNAHRALGHILPNFFHIQNYLGTARPHTWSLAVEEHFYLFLPFLLLLLTLGRNRLRWLPVIGFTIIVLCTGMRYLASAGREYDAATQYNPTHLRMDSLFFGVLIGYLYHFHGEWLGRLGNYRRTLLLVGIGLVIPMTLIDIRESWFVPVFGFALLYIGYGLILIAMIYTPLGEGLLGKVIAGPIGRCIAFVGLFSYPIYLWHIDLGRLPLHALAQTGFLSSLNPSLRWVVFSCLYVTVATLAGVILGLLVEKPALAVRDRFFPSRTQTVSKRVDTFRSEPDTPKAQLVEVGN